MTSLLLIPAALLLHLRYAASRTPSRASHLCRHVHLAGDRSPWHHRRQRACGHPAAGRWRRGQYRVTDGQAGGNMEGKESRFGIADLRPRGRRYTTAASNGSVNSMHD
ncbi:MAG: potassium-transporting ATPase subunit KdpA [Collinsella sp.]